VWDSIRLVIEIGIGSSLVWAARTLTKTQTILAPRLDANTAAIKGLTAAIEDRPEKIGFVLHAN
jgi:hypothetical protein